MSNNNEMTVKFDALSVNEAFARVCVSAFLMPLDPSVSELTDIKTAVSEAVTNAIIHGYNEKEGEVTIHCKISGDIVYIDIVDEGIGIDNIDKAKKPLYTTKPDMERSGMGFTVMEAFMDEVEVISELGKGTTVYLSKKITL